MRGIFFLGVVVVGLVAAGVITVKWNGSSATINVNKEKARERANQFLQEARTIEHDIEANAQSGAQTR